MFIEKCDFQTKCIITKSTNTGGIRIANNIKIIHEKISTTMHKVKKSMHHDIIITELIR